MLKIIEGGFNSGLAEHITDELRRRTEAGLRSLLIVPEQQTVTAEAEAAALLPDSAPLFFEATNFTRLANSVFRSLGGIAGEYCTKEKQRLIMWKTLTELSPFLTMTQGKSEVSAGLVDRAMSALAAADCHGVGAEALALAAENENIAENARLSSKVTDLSLISGLYKKLLSEKYHNGGDDLTAAADKLAANPAYLADTAIFVEGFTSFTEPQYRLLYLLLLRTDVTVALSVPKAESNSYEFREPRTARDRLTRLADKAGAEKKLVRIDGVHGVRSMLLCEAEKLLFRSEGIAESTEGSGEIRIFEAATPFDECDLIASDIKRRVIAGASYSDFAIVARDIQKYRGILDTSLCDYAIPFFTSQRKGIDSFEAIRLIYTVYSIVSGGFLREDVMTYAKCGLSGIDEEALDELELYCEKWQISGRGFSDGLSWNMDPRGYQPPSDSARLRRINETRALLIEPLISFAEDVNAALTVREHAEVLVRFLVGLRLEEKLGERAERLAELGEEVAADATFKLWKTVCESLDAIVSTLGDSKADANAFLMMLRTVFSEKSIGSIPAYLDEVTVGSADMLRLKNKKHIYLIGVNAGEFPASVSEDDYFTDRDKEALARAGLAFEFDTETKSARELYCFRRAFAFASESVTVTYAAASARQKPTPPADVVERLEEISGVGIIKTSDMSMFDFVYTPESAMLRLKRGDSPESRALRQALCDSGFSDMARVSELSPINSELSLSPELCADAYRGDLALTQSRIDRFVDCPLAYFCKFELKLDDNERASFNAANIGSFVHAILENFFRSMRENNLDVTRLSEADMKNMTSAAAKKYLGELFPEGDFGSARMRVMLSRLERASLPVVESLCREFADCKFLPTFFELKIARDNKDSPAPVTFTREDGGHVYVYGTIDRVDTYSKGADTYVRVIDYKTGTKQFSPKDLEDGRNLQMFLYLKSVIDTDSAEFQRTLGASDGGRVLPAGVIYVHTSISDTTVKKDDADLEREEISKTQKRVGMLLNDEDSIAAMNKDFLPVSLDKNGAIKQTDRLYTEEGWDALSKIIERAVLQVADGIRSGCAHAPKKQGTDKKICGYCDYKAICRNASL